MLITKEKMNLICSYMDDEIREDLHLKLAPCDNLKFLRTYCKYDPEFAGLLRNEFGVEL